MSDALNVKAPKLAGGAPKKTKKRKPYQYGQLDTRRDFAPHVQTKKT